jgi:acyl-CoA thioester hydrolase
MALTGARDYRGLDFIVARAELDYESPAYLGETITVTLFPTRVGTSSFTLEYLLTEKASGRLVGRGRTVLVHYDYSSRAKRPISGELRRILEEEVDRGAPGRPPPPSRDDEGGQR